MKLGMEVRWTYEERKVLAREEGGGEDVRRSSLPQQCPRKLISQSAESFRSIRLHRRSKSHSTSTSSSRINALSSPFSTAIRIAFVCPKNVLITPSFTCLPGIRSSGSSSAAVIFRSGFCGRRSWSVPAAIWCSRCVVHDPEGYRSSTSGGNGTLPSASCDCASQSFPISSPPNEEGSCPLAAPCASVSSFPSQAKEEDAP